MPIIKGQGKRRISKAEKALKKAEYNEKRRAERSKKREMVCFFFSEFI
jgi:hypothetical protein